MAKKYRVTLTDDERSMLTTLISSGSAPARTLTHARILLKADQAEGGPAWTDEAIHDALDVGLSTIARVRERFVEQSLEAALHRRSSPRHRQRLLDEFNAKLAHLRDQSESLLRCPAGIGVDPDPRVRSTFADHAHGLDVAAGAELDFEDWIMCRGADARGQILGRSDRNREGGRWERQITQPEQIGYRTA